MLADTHCHLYFKLFDQDLASVLERAWEMGLERILIPGIDLETSQQAVSLAEQNPRLFAAVGVHPNDSLTWNDRSLSRLAELAQHPKVVAIGEIGLDFYRDHAPHDHQRAVLQSQLDLAARLELPVVIHNREAWVDLWQILVSWQTALAAKGSSLASRPGVLHSFDGGAAQAVSAIEHHFLLGISGPVTFKNAPERQATVAALPLNALLIETDAPFLAPQRYRGRRNEPAYVKFIADKISELHQIPVSQVEEQTTRNATRLFRWDNTD